MNTGKAFQHPSESYFNIMRRFIWTNACLHRGAPERILIRAYDRLKHDNCGIDSKAHGTFLEAAESLRLSSTLLRQCPSCQRRFFHAWVFQFQWMVKCPIHGLELATKCPHCQQLYTIHHNKSFCEYCHPAIPEDSLVDRLSYHELISSTLFPYQNLAIQISQCKTAKKFIHLSQGHNLDLLSIYDHQALSLYITKKPQGTVLKNVVYNRSHIREMDIKLIKSKEDSRVVFDLRFYINFIKYYELKIKVLREIDQQLKTLLHHNHCLSFESLRTGYLLCCPFCAAAYRYYLTFFQDYNVSSMASITSFRASEMFLSHIIVDINGDYCLSDQNCRTLYQIELRRYFLWMATVFINRASPKLAVRSSMESDRNEFLALAPKILGIRKLKKATKLILTDTDTTSVLRALCSEYLTNTDQTEPNCFCAKGNSDIEGINVNQDNFDTLKDTIGLAQFSDRRFGYKRFRYLLKDLDRSELSKLNINEFYTDSTAIY